MKSATRGLPLGFGGRGGTCESGAARNDRRAPVVRAVEYVSFPRVSRDQRRGIGFTRDESASGMSLVTGSPEKIGALLRIIVRGVDGRPALDSVARVVWCSRRDDGRYWLGLAHVAEGRPRPATVSPSEGAEEVRASA